MLSAAKDANSTRWNRLFDLCQEVRAKSQLVTLEIRTVQLPYALETYFICFFA